MRWRVGSLAVVMVASSLVGEATWERETSRDRRAAPSCPVSFNSILGSKVSLGSLKLRGGGGGAREVKTKATKKKKQKEEEQPVMQTKASAVEGLSRAQKRAAKEAAKEQRRTGLTQNQRYVSYHAL